MITKRIIPCLDVRDGRVVKGVNFEGVQAVSYTHLLKKEEETGIPAEFILAQLALESNWGRSVPGEKGVLEESHNYADIRSSENNPDPAGIVLSWSEEDHAYIAYKAFHNDEEFWDYYCNLLGTRYRTEGRCV